MVISRFTTHLVVTTTTQALAAVDLDALVGEMVITERTLFLAKPLAHRISKAVITVAVAVVQEPHGQAHQVMVVLVASGLSGVHQEHVRIPRTPHKELTRCKNIIYV